MHVLQQSPQPQQQAAAQQPQQQATMRHGGLRCLEYLPCIFFKTRHSE
jgi:hypothetical protein